MARYPALLPRQIACWCKVYEDEDKEEDQEDEEEASLNS